AYLLMAAHALLAGRAGAEISPTGVETAPGAIVSYTLAPADLRKGVRFDNRGGAPVWRTVVARGAPTSAPPEAAERITAVKRVSRLAGSQADLSPLTQGDRLVVSITLSSRERQLHPLIVADLLPAGFEIEATLRAEDGASSNTDVAAGPYAWIGTI